MLDEERDRWVTHYLGLVLGRVCPEDISGDLDCRANNHDNEEPSSVFDEGEVRYNNKDDAVHDGTDDGEGKGWVIHPYRLFVGHFDRFWG